MLIKDLIEKLEALAPPSLQEGYDNSGLLTGTAAAPCTGALISLDVTEDVVREAVANRCNLIISHHPIIFSGLKQLTGKNHVERVVIAAIKNDIALYAIHTNLDNVLEGVNGKIADVLGLQKRDILRPKESQLRKLVTFAPPAEADAVREAIFEAGGGHIGKYSECSFVSEGRSSFKPEEGADPTVGEIGKREEGKELKMEFIFAPYREKAIIAAMKSAHSYEEVAYDIISLGNYLSDRGSGLIGELTEPKDAKDFLSLLATAFRVPAIRYTGGERGKIRKVAVCGGAGSFLLKDARTAGADAFVTADLKYHEFFDGEGELLVADIGHFESEQFTIDLLYEVLRSEFPNFALLKTALSTNPVHHFIAEKR